MKKTTKSSCTGAGNAALTQAILDLIVHIDLEFERSYVKHIDVEIHKINKPHNIQNIAGYIVSIALL